jgi:F-type H+-transporting ATPase subunit gamma
MASIKDLRKRIGTVKNTQQTTKAMKMVSAAKLRRAQEAISAHRPYALELKSLLAQTLEHPASASVKSPLIVREGSDWNAASVNSEGKSVLLVLVTSDRGLCGGFNANIIKGAQRWLKAHQGEYSRVEMAFVGKKAFDFFKGRLAVPAVFHHEFGAKMSYARSKKLTADILAPYLDGRVQEVIVLYNEFKNAVTQKVTAESLVPLKVGVVAQSESTGEITSGVPPLVKPDPAAVASTLLDKHFPVQIYRILLESQAGEHGARMSAMENATKNAGEMIRHLTLQYNKQRQAGITKELLEIIAGSESQKSAG